VVSVSINWCVVVAISENILNNFLGVGVLVQLGHINGLEGVPGSVNGDGHTAQARICVVFICEF
jgi:hypothetical protein